MCGRGVSIRRLRTSSSALRPRPTNYSVSCARTGTVDAHWGTLVDNLHVRLGHQGRGLGRRLLAASAIWSRERYQDALLHLWVLEANAKARRFYELLGAQPQESAVHEPPGGGSVTTWRYVWFSIDPLLAQRGEEHGALGLVGGSC